MAPVPLLSGIYREFSFTIVMPAAGAVLGRVGDPSATKFITGTDTTKPILYWEFQASSANADNMKVAKGSAAFPAPAADSSEGYFLVAPGTARADLYLSGDVNNQFLRVASDGAGDVTITGRVICKVQ